MAAELGHRVGIHVRIHGGCFILLILIDPLVPVDGDARVLDLLFHDTGPVLSFLVLLGDSDDGVAAVLVEFAVSFDDRSEEFHGEAVGDAVRSSLEIKNAFLRQFHGNVLAVLKLDGHEETLFALGPLDAGEFKVGG